MIKEIPWDIFQLLYFTMPGFFFVWALSISLGKKIESDFEYLMLSLSSGVILTALLYVIFPDSRMTAILQSPYAAAIGFSLITMALGFSPKIIRLAKRHL